MKNKIRLTNETKQTAKFVNVLANKHKQDFTKISKNLKLTKIKENLRIIKKLNILKANLLVYLYKSKEHEKYKFQMNESVYDLLKEYNNKGKKVQLSTAIGLVVLDYFANTILMSILVFIIPDKLAELFSKLLIKIINILVDRGIINGITSAEAVYYKSLNEKIDKANKECSKQTEKLEITNNTDIMKLINGSKLKITKFAIAAAVSGAIIEEGSKEIAARTGCGVAYSIAFNTFETGLYMVQKVTFKQRIAPIIMHVINSVLHNFPKLRPFAYLIHAIWNGFVSPILAFHNSNKRL